MRVNDRTEDALPAAAVAALERGNKIEAIKITREARGIGLKESKETVEAYVATRPDLQQKLGADAGKAVLRLALIVGAAVVVYLVATRLL